MSVPSQRSRSSGTSSDRVARVDGCTQRGIPTGRGFECRTCELGPHGSLCRGGSAARVRIAISPEANNIACRAAQPTRATRATRDRVLSGACSARTAGKHRNPGARPGSGGLADGLVQHQRSAAAAAPAPPMLSASLSQYHFSVVRVSSWCSIFDAKSKFRGA